ncbi:hypothetical protein GP486_003589 [Trichoglossum hirsutum]|uniref:Low temperature requirement A n=1 Tax=Trichoglossum hirsutum TaxID=265104 RepID=A0A9P8LCZ4_9PEZI|nr:hypothetical protein GP486_003589 [Trichoglossum hirsutum]
MAHSHGHSHPVSIKHTLSNGGPREKYEARKEERLRFIVSPLKNVGEHGEFSQREEASKIELFYDLFFVANLTTFTSVHEINDRKALSSYAGFFAIIWVTWLQVTLFDCRFAVDSFYDRVCKVIQLMVMIGYSSVGPEFDPNVTKNFTIFKTLTLLLLVSSALLAVQYTIVVAFVARKRKETIIPLLFIVAIFAIASVVYLWLFFSFNSEKNDKRYYVWYVFLAIQTIAVMGVSVRWRSLSFKRTHLAERLGLLTLIILGEGVIVLTKSLNYIVGEDGWTQYSFGQAVVVVLTIYLLWALYFDRHPETHFGTIRQQIWCLLHFPFHLCLVLMLEGINNFLLYHKAVHQFLKVYNIQLPDSTTTFIDDTLIQTLNETINDMKLDNGKSAESLPDIYSALSDLSAFAKATLDDQSTAIYKLLTKILAAIFKKYGFEPPKSAVISKNDNPIKPIVSVILLNYRYFFASAGIVLLLLAVFVWFVRRRKDIYDWIAVGTRGLGAVILIACIFISYREDTMFKYLEGPMILPTVLIVLLIVLFIDKVTDMLALWRGRKYASLKSSGGGGIELTTHPSPERERLYPDKSGVQYGETQYSHDPRYAQTQYAQTQYPPSSTVPIV